MGADAALVKGGHIPGEMVMDTLVTADGAEVFEHPRVETDATHGSGCALASAITARLAHGDTLDGAVETGLSSMERAIRYPLDVGEGPGSVQHLTDLRNRAAREPTSEEIETIVEGFTEQDISPLVPEVGMNVVGATPFAETQSETAAVEGRIVRTLSGVNPNRGVRFGASGHVARFLLAAREFDSELRYAVNCRFDDDVAEALDTLDWSVAEYDRSDEPEQVKEADEATMGWGAQRAFENSDETPIAVIDRGEVGKEAMVKLLAAEGETLAERTFSLLDALAVD